MSVTVEHWVTTMTGRIQELSFENVMKAAIYDIQGDVIYRVFSQGKNSKNEAIGRYSTKTMLATKNQFPNKSKFKQSLAASGITFSQNIKTRKMKTHRSRATNKKLWIKFPKASKAVPVMIIEGGYSEFKRIVKGTDVVNLWLFGELRSDAASGALRKIQDGYDWRLKKDINQKKVEYLTKHFGGTSIFGLTKDERTKFEKNVRAEVLRIMNK